MSETEDAPRHVREPGLRKQKRMKLDEPASPRLPKGMPVFGSPFRALASGMVTLVILLGFAVYALISANAALPGDWQYPIKLRTERVRLALAFSDDAKLDLKLDVADERVSEIEQLTKHGEIIGPGVLDRVVKQTQTLIDDAKDGGWDADKAARLDNFAKRQQEVLADASAQIAPEAQEQLAAAAAVSRSAQKVSEQILFFADPHHPPTVLTPSVPLAPSVPLPRSASLPSTGVAISEKPEETRNGIEFYRITAGALSFLAPGSGDGWKLVDAPEKGLPPLIKLANAGETSLITISTVTGDMYWYIGQDGHFDEVQMRIKQSGGTLVADRSVLRTAYGDTSDIPWLVLQSITLLPPSPATTAGP